MHRLAFALLLCPLVAASALAQPVGEPLDSALRSARSDQAAADAETARLQDIAANARGEAERLNAEQAAAAQAIDAAEARITTADTRLRLASGLAAAHRAQLAQAQRPVASLLAGLALMARRPPLLALADRGGVDELVKLRILLESTLPVIRRRTLGIAAGITEDEQLQGQAANARAELVRSRNLLVGRRAQFAALEQKARQRSLSAGGAALGAGDVAIAAGEEAERILREQAGGQSARAVAEKLAAADPAPPRPFGSAGSIPPVPFAYRLPASAPVTEGLGAVDDSGVRSRGIALATARGAALEAPADGVVRFSGPFRDYDGVVIIDHGGGWLSLLVNVSSPLHPGDKVRLGEPLGRALGPIRVELSRDGRRVSPALIAGSSRTLSNAAKGG